MKSPSGGRPTSSEKITKRSHFTCLGDRLVVFRYFWVNVYVCSPWLTGRHLEGSACLTIHGLCVIICSFCNIPLKQLILSLLRHLHLPFQLQLPPGNGPGNGGGRHGAKGRCWDWCLVGRKKRWGVTTPWGEFFYAFSNFLGFGPCGTFCASQSQRTPKREKQKKTRPFSRDSREVRDSRDFRRKDRFWILGRSFQSGIFRQPRRFWLVFDSLLLFCSDFLGPGAEGAPGSRAHGKGVIVLKGVRLPCNCLFESPFLEPPSKNPSQNASSLQSPLQETTEEPILRKRVLARPPWSAPYQHRRPPTPKPHPQTASSLNVVFSRGWCTNSQNLKEEQVFTKLQMGCNKIRLKRHFCKCWFLPV